MTPHDWQLTPSEEFAELYICSRCGTRAWKTRNGLVSYGILTPTGDLYSSSILDHDDDDCIEIILQVVHEL